SGITVPKSRIERVRGKAVLLSQRFDREGRKRVPFLSATSMLGADDRETRSYLEIVDAIRKHGAAPAADITMLWRRIVFNVLISNTDDHLRNHGFLYRGATGWTLSPAYDLNPSPLDLGPRILSTAIDLDDNTASLALALGVVEYFELSEAEASRIAREVARAVTRWRDVAAGLGLASSEIERMESAFEHDDLGLAMS
ncbi:MAG: type II toxin-antitoxin system HipA family toxin, partial [Vicinamibacteria bacterium]